MPQSQVTQARVNFDKAAPTGELSFTFSDTIYPFSAPTSIQAEGIGALRTHMIAQHLQDGRRSLAICGASEGVGATFVAANLAAAFALAGIRTLVVDANLREPGLDALITPSKPLKGLSDYLSDDSVTLFDCIQEEVLPNLSVLYAGTLVDNPQELLAGRRFVEAMEDCMRDYDIMLVDTPPGNLSADTRRIAVAVRYALIVARKDVSFVSDLKTFAAELQSDRAKVIGTFLNDF